MKRADYVERWLENCVRVFRNQMRYSGNKEQYEILFVYPEYIDILEKLVPEMNIVQQKAGSQIVVGIAPTTFPKSRLQEKVLFASM